MSVPFEDIAYIDDGVYAVQFSTGIAEDRSQYSGVVREEGLGRERYEDWEQGLQYLEEVRRHPHRNAGPVWPAVESLHRQQQAMAETGRGGSQRTCPGKSNESFWSIVRLTANKYAITLPTRYIKESTCLTARTERMLYSEGRHWTVIRRPAGLLHGRPEAPVPFLSGLRRGRCSLNHHRLTVWTDHI